jgi:hypothetical protein
MNENFLDLYLELLGGVVLDLYFGEGKSKKKKRKGRK